MDKAEISRRVKCVRSQLSAAGVDGLIVIGIENVRYLTNFSGHDSWALVLPKTVILVTDSRYAEQAKGECIGCRIVQRKGGLSKETANILNQSSQITVIGIEDTCSIGLLKSLRKELSFKIRPMKDIVENVRMIKTDAEVKLISRAGEIAFDALGWALKHVKVGMTELQLAALYDYRLSEYNAKPGFETIVAFGPNGSRNHHQPGSRRLQKNDVILCDLGANYKGYISDITRVFAVGKVSQKFRNIYQTVAHAHDAAIAKVCAGVKIADVDAAARERINREGLPVFGHGTGHGLGLQVHESPYVSPHNKTGVLAEGNIITIEPGVYLPGEFGIRLEDDVLVTKKGAKVLTKDGRFQIEAENIIKL